VTSPPSEGFFISENQGVSFSAEVGQRLSGH
jgi:hypothetical protein